MATARTENEQRLTPNKFLEFDVSRKKGLAHLYQVVLAANYPAVELTNGVMTVRTDGGNMLILCCEDKNKKMISDKRLLDACFI